MKRQNPEKFYWYKMEPYKDDPVGFVVDILGAEPTKQQRDALEAIGTGTHVSIRSGHGTGKTAFDAWCILWWMYTRFNARVPCTAPTEAQLKNVLWAELSLWHQRMDKFFQDKFVCTSDRFYHAEFDKTWFAVARTARAEKPEALQGFHGLNLLFIIDEASGVAEEVFTVVRGALTDDMNRCIMTSNPTRTTGFFYNSHTLWEGKPWRCLQFSGEESPLVSDRYINEIAVEFGKDSDVYRVRVLGDFPVESDFTLIPKTWVEEALKRSVSYVKRLSGKQFDAAGVDVARYGENKTVFVLVRGVTVVGILIYHKQSTMKTAEQVIGLCQRMIPSDIKIDEIGVGAGVVDRVVDRGYGITAINVGQTATDKDKFANLRAEYYWGLRKRFEEGSISLKPLVKILTKEQMVQFIEQICSIRYEYSPSGKITMWSKEKMKREKIGSPDMADALMLAFADYYPELFKQPSKTWGERWDEALAASTDNRFDDYEEWAHDFHKINRYIEDEDNVEGVYGW